MMQVKCPQCHGNGTYMTHSDYFNIDYPVKCTVCDGSGKVPKGLTQAGRKRNTDTTFKYRNQPRKGRDYEK